MHWFTEQGSVGRLEGGTSLMTLLERAELIAREAHQNDLRKFKNVDYITHPQAVVELLEFEWDKCLGWLHDVMEDHPTVWVPEKLRNRGIPSKMIAELGYLTKRKDETYFDFIMRICGGPNSVVCVKIADITHNLSDLDPLGHKNLRDKYRLSRYILEQRLKGNYETKM